MSDKSVSETDEQELCENAPLEVENVVKPKRESKLTEKALLAKIDDLEKKRKSFLHKAANVKEEIYKLMSNKGSCEEVKQVFSTYEFLVNDAKNAHECLLEFLPISEKEKNEIWFKAKLLSVNDCFETVKEYPMEYPVYP